MVAWAASSAEGDSGKSAAACTGLTYTFRSRFDQSRTNA
jgi:hypothetical protein